MNKVHRRRILKLAAFLAGPVKRAAKRSGRRKLNMEEYANSCEIGLKPIQCGTSACALGWATLVFPRSLSLNYFDPERAHEDEAFKAAWPYLNGERMDFSEIGEAFFGMDSWQAEKAFGPTRRTIDQEVTVLRKIAG